MVVKARFSYVHYLFRHVIQYFCKRLTSCFNSPRQLIGIINIDIMKNELMVNFIHRNSTRCEAGRQLKWLKMKVFHFQNDKPGDVGYFYDHSGDFKIISASGGYPLKVPTIRFHI